MRPCFQICWYIIDTRYESTNSKETAIWNNYRTARWIQLNYTSWAPTGYTWGCKSTYKDSSCPCIFGHLYKETSKKNTPPPRPPAGSEDLPRGNWPVEVLPQSWSPVWPWRKMCKILSGWWLNQAIWIIYTSGQIIIIFHQPSRFPWNKGVPFHFQCVIFWADIGRGRPPPS